METENRKVDARGRRPVVEEMGKSWEKGEDFQLRDE